MRKTEQDLSARQRVERLAAAFELRTDFSQAVHDEVEQHRRAFLRDRTSLRDLTAVPFVTIDNDDSRDLDQAVWISATPEASPRAYTVLYALADAAYYVRPASALFEEAMSRGVTYYFPGFAIPMLPPDLSEDLVSLNPHVDRRALVFELSLDSAGRCLDSRFYRALVRSRAKLSYRDVQALYDGDATLCERAYADSLWLLKTVGELRIHDADERDIVRYDRYETEVRLPLDEHGALAIDYQPRLDVEDWNAEISLLCNVEGARFLRLNPDSELRIEGIFRVHPRPGAEQLDALAQSIARLVETRRLPERRWRWRRPEESLADYLARLPDEGEDWRLSMAIQRQALVLNRRAEFSTEAGAHHGIGAAQYSRFSSPMRELVGVLTHHLAMAQACGISSGLSRERIESAIEVGNRAQTTQKQIARAVLELALYDYFAPELDLVGSGERPPEHRGTVMGISENRIHVRLDDPPVDLKVDTGYLERQDHVTFVLSDDETELRRLSPANPSRPVAQLGAEIMLRVADYDERKGRWLFAIGSLT